MAGMDDTGGNVIDKAQINTEKTPEDRPVTFTGDRWLDGVIWARALHINNRTAGMHLTTLPAPFIEAVMDACEKTGVDCDFQEIKEHEDGVIPIRLILHARDPIFRKLTNVKGDRWLSPSFDLEFLKGYLQAIMCFANSGLSMRPSPKLMNDLKAVLDALGIPYSVAGNPVFAAIHIKSSKHIDANGIIPGFMAFARLEDEKIKFMEASMDPDERSSEVEIETVAMLYNRDARQNARPLKDLTNEQLMNIISDTGPRSRTKRRVAVRELGHRDAKGLAADFANLVIARTVRRRLEEDILLMLFKWGCKEELVRILHGKISPGTEFLVRHYLFSMERAAGYQSRPEISDYHML